MPVTQIYSGLPQVSLLQGSLSPLTKEQQVVGSLGSESPGPSLLCLRPAALALWLLPRWALASGPGGDHLALLPDPEGHLR